MEDFTPRTIEPQAVDPATESSQSHTNPEGVVDTGASLLSSYEIGSYFNADMNDSRDSDKAEELTAKLAQMGFTGADALLYIQSVENRLAPPDVGVDRLNHFWNYFKLVLASNDINKRKQIYEE